MRPLRAMKTARSVRSEVSGVMGFVSFSTALVVACGSEPKKETATATAPSAEPASADAGGAAETVAAADAGGGKSDKQTECDALLDDANASLDAKRIEVKMACKKDDDCVAIKGRACHFSCANGAIPKTEEKAWTAAVQKAKDGQCKKWDEKECSKLRTKPTPTCQDRKVWCEKGQCALKGPPEK